MGKNPVQYFSSKILYIYISLYNIFILQKQLIKWGDLIILLYIILLLAFFIYLAYIDCLVIKLDFGLVFAQIFTEIFQL